MLVPFVPFGECAVHRFRMPSWCSSAVHQMFRNQLSSIHVLAVQAVRCHCLRCTGCNRTRRPRTMPLIAAVHAPGCSGYAQTVTLAFPVEH